MAAAMRGHLLQLPFEILAKILSCKTLDEIDICRVSQVCLAFHDLCRSNNVWKVKFHQRWPLTVKLEHISFPPDGWMEFYKVRKEFSQQVQATVKDIAAKYYHREEVSNEGFRELQQMQELNELGKCQVAEDLRTILDSASHSRLTDKYYAKKAFYYLHHRHLRDEITAFLSLPNEDQSLEKGATFVADWMRPSANVSLSAVKQQLDNIADQVRAELRQVSPGHPACSKHNSIKGFVENLWSPDQCREVLQAVNEVLFDELSFQPNEMDYHDPQNSNIDQVLQSRKGIPITLSVIYSVVARRLGVVCEPVNFPRHFLLRWKEHPAAVGLDQYTFIDAYNKGKARTAQQCVIDLLLPVQSADSAFFQAATVHQVLERMANNIVSYARTSATSEDRVRLLHDGIDLFLTISPTDRDMRLLQIRIFMHLSINLRDVLEYLQTLAPRGEILSLMRECESQLAQSQLEENKTQGKLRSRYPEVRFSVGMIMRHKRYDYMCVIYGWDHECQASEEWIIRMGVDRLSGRQYQPFYNVLVEDGSNRYAAQENLLYTQDVCTIQHMEVGKFFEEFTGSYYVPNSFKSKEYPDDMKVTQTLVDSYFTSVK